MVAGTVVIIIARVASRSPRPLRESCSSIRRLVEKEYGGDAGGQAHCADDGGGEAEEVVRVHGGGAQKRAEARDAAEHALGQVSKLAQ